MSQNSEILKDLKKGKKITPIDALNNYGCFRLSARILDIRQMGYEILSVMVERDGKQFARYELVQ